MATVAQTISAGWLDVPWIIWSGLISSLVASGVAAFTIWASSKNSLRLLAKQHEHNESQANLQRKHDAKQKDEDRKATIRREIYAKAVEESHALLGFIGGLPDRPLSLSNDDEGFQSFLKANAKIWLVADAEAAHLSRDLASDFADVFIHGLTAAYPIRLAMEPIRRRREEIEFARGEVRRLATQVADSKASNASAQNQTKLDDLMVEAQEHVDALEFSQQEAIGDTAQMRIQAFQTTFGKLRPVQRAIVKMVSALREELNLPRDDDEFMVQLEDMEHRAWSAVNSAYGLDSPRPMPGIIKSV